MNITGRELREKYINFFKNYPGLEHHVLDSAPLVPSDEDQLEGKEKVLFTSAGMQPLIPYLTGKKQPPFSRLVDCQKCLRTDDIEEVGDNTHHTFFEMLGNWGIGDYWKKEAIELSYKFLVNELGIDKKRLFVTVFAGDEDAPRDDEAANAWKDMGIEEERISYLGKEDNWWPTSRREPDGTLKNAYGPCGPDTEIFYWTGEGEPEGRPETDDRWVEIWNNVFMQYNRKDDGTLEDLPTKNVDTGMGLERTLSILTGKKNAYETDLFEQYLRALSEVTKLNYGEKDFVDSSFRIVADHLRAAEALILEEVFPSNKLQGYILRRLIRRAVYHLILLNNQHGADISLDRVYMLASELKESKVEAVLKEEAAKFRKVIGNGLRLLEQEVTKGGVSTKFIFDLYQSGGFPIELTVEVLNQKGLEVNMDAVKEEFKKHQEASRTVSAGKFAGGLAGHSDIEVKYHTATHLLHQALRDVLGQTVFQKGSNITPERLRFDFSFDRKMTPEELKKVEEIVNQKIKADLKVERTYMTYDKAMAMNAIGLFGDKYDKTNVSIYAMGPADPMDPESKDQRERGGYYSLEFCGGPHVEHTNQVGGIKLVKEEAVSAGVRRIRAELV